MRKTSLTFTKVATLFDINKVVPTCHKNQYKVTKKFAEDNRGLEKYSAMISTLKSRSVNSNLLKFGREYLTFVPSEGNGASYVR